MSLGAVPVQRRGLGNGLSEWPMKEETLSNGEAAGKGPVLSRW